MQSMHAQQGFSLIEVMVAVLVLSVGLTGLASFQNYIIQSNNLARDRNAALSLAREQVETVRLQAINNFNAIQTNSTTNSTVYIGASGKTAGTDNAYSSFRVSSSITQPNINTPAGPAPNPDLIQVGVSVEWEDRGDKTGGKTRLPLTATIARPDPAADVLQLTNISTPLALTTPVCPPGNGFCN